MEDILDDKELNSENINIVYGGFWARFGALLLDGLIIGGPIGLINYFILDNVNFAWLILLLSQIPTIYKPFWEYKYGTTIGKKIVNLKIVNMNYESPSLQEVLMRNIFSIAIQIFSTINTIYTMLYPNKIIESTIYNNSGGLGNAYWNMMAFPLVILLLYLIDTIMLVTDEKSQSLHDRIGKTYVIYN